MIETDKKKLIRIVEIRRDISREPTDNTKIIRGYCVKCNTNTFKI